MLDVYMGLCAPNATLLGVVSLNVPVSEIGESGDDAVELIDTLISPYPDPETESLQARAWSRFRESNRDSQIS
jgi:hypothetical protein